MFHGSYLDLYYFPRQGDGYLQMISDDAQTDRELARQEAISQVTDCKTT